MLSFLKPTLSFLKKAFLVVAVYFVVISLFSHFIKNDKIPLSSKTDLIEKNRIEIYGLINDKKINSTKEGKMVMTSFRTLYCRIIGEACVKNPNDSEKNYQNSMAGFFSNLLKTSLNLF